MKTRENILASKGVWKCHVVMEPHIKQCWSIMEGLIFEHVTILNRCFEHVYGFDLALSSFNFFCVSTQSANSWKI